MMKNGRTRFRFSNFAAAVVGVAFIAQSISKFSSGTRYALRFALAVSVQVTIPSSTDTFSLAS